MNRSFLVLILLIPVSLAFGQVPDSTGVVKDTLSKTPTPAPVPAPAAAPAPVPMETAGPKRTFSEKFAFGFGTGFWITPGTTYIELAPTVAYRFPRALITGIGYRYIYRHDRYLNNDLHSYGPNVFARLNLLKRVYLWTEYEYLNSQYFDYPYFNNEDYTRETDHVDSWFAGLGYVRSLGRKGRGGISVQVLYNFLYDNTDRNPYYSAWSYRVGYFF